MGTQAPQLTCQAVSTLGEKDIVRVPAIWMGILVRIPWDPTLPLGEVIDCALQALLSGGKSR